MPELSFQIEGAEAMAYSATPTIALKLRIANRPEDEAVHTMILRCQVQIDPARRRYSGTEQENLHDLYGEPSRWSRTVRALLWMNTSVSVPGFTGSTVVDVPLPCTFDFNVAATKYFHALEGGEIPLTVMFSGTVFYADADGHLQVTQIPWDREASFRMPIATWKQLMDAHYPNTAWLCLQRDVFDRLYEYKVRNEIPTFERTLDELLNRAEETGALPEAGAQVKA